MGPARARPNFPRYHSLDRLRAVTMLTGLVLHTGINYFPFPVLEAEQIYLDPQSSPFFDYLVKFLRSFRTALFMVIAGFFAAFLFEYRGPALFLRHRWARIGVPMIGAWIVIYPATVGLAVWANTMSVGRPLTAVTTRSMSDVLDTVLIHFWFLYFLLIFCVVARVVVPLVQSTISVEARERFLDHFNRAVHWVGGPILFAIPTAITLYPMETWTFDPAAALLPSPFHLAAFAVFFVYGWCVYTRREAVGGFKARARIHLVLGLVLHAAHVYAFEQGYGVEGAEREHLLSVTFLALSIWFLIYSLLGIFLRYFDKPSMTWRYVSDASYWMYLVHLPITIALPPLLGEFALPSGVKFSLVLGATTAICIVSYHYCARATFIGKRLSGRRYPRVAPWRATS